MAVLPDLGDQDARRPAFRFAESRYRLFRPLDLVGALQARSFVDSSDSADLRSVPAPGFFKGQRYLADRRACPCRIDRRGKQISFMALGDREKSFESRAALLRVALCAQALELLDLACSHRGVIDLANVDRRLCLC